MKNKFEKYWGNFDNMNHLLYVGLVLDPLYKLRYLEYYFGTLYERQKAIDMARRVKAVLEDLYKSYTKNQVGSSSASATAQVVVLVLLHKPKTKNQVDQWREVILVWLTRR